MSGPYEDLFLENGNINESPILFYIGGGYPLRVYEFPLSLCSSDVTRGGGEEPDTSPLGVCCSPPSTLGPPQPYISVFVVLGVGGVGQSNRQSNKGNLN